MGKNRPSGVEHKALLQSLQSDAATGRRMLVVLGSGCSVSCSLPTMSRIFKWLHKRLEEMLRDEAYQAAKNTVTIRSLQEDLETMKNSGGSRAVAARALRLLQHAPLQTHLQPFGRKTETPNTSQADSQAATELCAALWRSFAIAFLDGQIGTSGDMTSVAAETVSVPETVLLKEPSEFHKLVADLVQRDRAVPLSLNFDGFTRKAIDEALAQAGSTSRSVILSSPDTVRGFFCASATKFGPSRFVVKVWGDVFHAVCHTPSCPQFQREVPLYDIARPDIKSRFAAAELQRGLRLSPDSQVSADTLLRCPDCGGDRQLQVFFAGYQEKEERTESLISALEPFVAPGIGSLLIAGFSGDWDSKLADFLVTLARRIDDGSNNQPRVFCVDEKKTHIYHLIKATGVQIKHYDTKCDSFAHSVRHVLESPKTQNSPHKEEEDSLNPVVLDDPWAFWKDLLSRPKDGRYAVPQWCSELKTKGMLADTFGLVRQLGVKTVMLRAGDWPHNRLFHSIGCATLTWRWQKELETHGYAPRIPVYPISATMLAAAFHDIGHLPFSHLAEQALGELNWTIGPDEAFHHDSGTFQVAWDGVAEEARALLKSAWPGNPPANAEQLIMRLIEGRSGIAHLDAILNSPIDTDKIDYVFRDCQMLGQAVHLPIGHVDSNGGETSVSREERRQWVETLFQNQLVLPSGLIALYGLGGEKARELLEERWYLYRNVYFRPVFRGIERLARAILVLWLVRGLSKQHAPSEGHVQRWVDSREIAGRFARDALWSMLSNKDKKERVTGGEPAMVETMAQGLMNDASLPNAAKEWIDACRQGIAKLRLNNDGPQTRSLDDLERELPKHITLSQPLFVTKHDYDTRIREAIRTLEYERPFVGLIDAAVMPRMLSYPHPSCAERYVVPHRDPDHWGRQPSGQWVPLSSTAYAAWDEERWVQLLIISPHPYDYNNIGHIEDRLRTECRRLGVLPRELMPNPEGGHSDGSGGRKN